MLVFSNLVLSWPRIFNPSQIFRTLTESVVQSLDSRIKMLLTIPLFNLPILMELFIFLNTGLSKLNPARFFCSFFILHDIPLNRYLSVFNMFYMQHRFCFSGVVNFSNQFCWKKSLKKFSIPYTLWEPYILKTKLDQKQTNILSLRCFVQPSNLYSIL